MTKAQIFIANRQQVIAELKQNGMTPAQISANLRRSYDGEANPNFRGAGKKTCVQCGSLFNSYQPTRKYCTRVCYHAARAELPKAPRKPKKSYYIKKEPKQKSPKKPYVPKPRVVQPSVKVQSQCRKCAGMFSHYPSNVRIYCSYPCFIADGGAHRAGMASKKAVMKYGQKKDANHNEIIAALTSVGVLVYDTSDIGGGFPDLICGIHGRIFLMEIKNPKTGYGRKGLNKNQQRFFTEWSGFPIFCVDGIEAALQMVKVIPADPKEVKTFEGVQK